MSATRVLVTGPTGEGLADRLRARGWDARAIPTVAIHPVELDTPFDDALRRLDIYDWVVVTSANGVRAVYARLRALRAPVPLRLRWAAVGPVTAAALAEEGIRASFVPGRHLTSAIAAGLGEIGGRRILLPRADRASPDLPWDLRARGAVVDEVVAYRTEEGPQASRRPLRALLAEGIGAVVFTSGSTVRGFTRLVDDPPAALAGALVACIGPVTAGAVAALGLRPDLVATEYTTEGLIDALERRRTGAAVDTVR